MIWLTWRQFRASAAAVLGALAVAALAMVVTGPQLADLLKTSGESFFDRLETDTLLKQVFVVGTLLTYVVPGVVGAFWGAPMVAREIEAGTHRLVWTQSITRTRWLGTKLAVAAAAAALAGSLGLLLTWWGSPLDEAVRLGFGGDTLFGARIRPELFGSRGLVAVATSVLALVIGVTVGLLIRRTVAAMAVTFVTVATMQLLMPVLVQERLAAPETVTTAITKDNLMFVTGVPDDPETPVGGIEVAMDKPGAWVTAQATVDARGDAVESLPAYVRDCAEGTGANDEDLDACIAKLAADGIQQQIAYHPASQFWVLQWRAAALLVGAAAGLAGFCFWRLRRDL